jgi:hypothetical protein
MKKSIACAAVTLALAGGASAQGVQVRGIVGGGLTFGGDTLATLDYVDDDVDDAKVHAGGLIAVNAGVELQFTPMVSAQALIGYHFDRANASNGSVRFERTPFELLGHFRVNDWFRLGGGARYTSGAKFRSSGFSELRNVDFKPTWGTVVEGEFFPTQSFGIKLRYVAEKFKAKDAPDAQTLEGNHGGVYFNFYF